MLKERTEILQHSNRTEELHHCPELLVSVRDAEEAKSALRGGADWIDLKEPRRGALGAVDFEIATEVSKEIAGRLPLSAALGELVDWPDASSIKLLEIIDLNVVKIGLAKSIDHIDWKQKWKSLNGKLSDLGKQLVAAAYADWESVKAPSPHQVIELAVQSGSQYFLLDTFSKGPNSLLDFLPEREIESIILSANQAGMKIVLAGGLNTAYLGRLPDQNIDMIAVRGAVCTGTRDGRATAENVKSFRAAVAQRWPKS